jgi:hypothetical protein
MHVRLVRVGLAGKTKYMEIGHLRSMMALDHMMKGSNPYGKVKSLKCLGSLVTNQNYIHEEIKCRLKAGNSR